MTEKEMVVAITILVLMSLAAYLTQQLAYGKEFGCRQLVDVLILLVILLLLILIFINL